MALAASCRHAGRVKSLLLSPYIPSCGWCALGLSLHRTQEVASSNLASSIAICRDKARLSRRAKSLCPTHVHLSKDVSFRDRRSPGRYHRLVAESRTDAEALDQLAQELNSEPIDAYVSGGLEWVREVVRSTGRTVAASAPAPDDHEPTSGY